jgi:sugar phosphate isomerase/epimerase
MDVLAAGKHVICEKPLTGYFGTEEDPTPLGLHVSRQKMLDIVKRDIEEMGEAIKSSGQLFMYAEHDDFSTSARILDLISGISTGEVGVIWDVLHPYRFGEAVEDTYAALKDKIFHVHIKDSANYSPSGFDITLIGEGKVPIKKCFDLLKKDGYESYLSFEWEKLWHPEIPEPEIAIPHYAKNIIKFM